MWILLSERGGCEYIPEALMIHRRPPLVQLIDKYEAGRRTFERLVSTRYGNAASYLIRESRLYFSGVLVAGATAELDAGHLGEALRLLSRALRYCPFLFLNPTLRARMFNIRNARRLAGAVVAHRVSR